MRAGSHVLITGATGQVAFPVALALAADHRVTAIARFRDAAKRAALEAAEFGVRINAVAPSLAMHAFLSKVTTDELLDELTTREAFGRAAEPWEVANVIAFLASGYATFMTGEVVSVSSQHP